MKAALPEAYVTERRSAARVLYVSNGLAPAAARAGLITPPYEQPATRLFENFSKLYRESSDGNHTLFSQIQLKV